VDDYRHALYGMRIKYEVIQGGTSVDETSETVGSMPIKEIFPIPFSYETVIKYEVPKTNTVSIKIFDEAGRLVRTLVDNTMSQGSYSARWDGRDTEGRKVAAGSYFCVVKTNGHSTTKVVYIK
jgi:flagellar hook assembly protein FlgD